jgi:hypothetical protein
MSVPSPQHQIPTDALAVAAPAYTWYPPPSLTHDFLAIISFFLFRYMALPLNWLEAGAGTEDRLIHELCH